MKPIGNHVKIEKSTDANKEIFDFKEIIEAPKSIYIKYLIILIFEKFILKKLN